VRPDDSRVAVAFPESAVFSSFRPLVTAAQRPALEELSAATAQAIDMLKSACPKDLPSTPTGRLAAMESRLQVMLAAVQTMRPALDD
jgi:LTXXQ motif family protein